MYFQYDEAAIEYLKAKDMKLAAVIDKLGYIRRETDNDLFAAVVHHIVGQQISSKAQATIWQRLQNMLGTINAGAVMNAGLEKLQSTGVTFKKAEYILDFAEKVYKGVFDIEALTYKSDEEAIAELKTLKGIGVWTAEMILLFSLNRMNIFSYDDLAIQRGLRMIYHHRKIDKRLFAKYRRRFTPYGSVASLYIWAVAGGAIEGMRDYAPKAKKS